MKTLAVLGQAEFTLGFRLTGIKTVVDAARNTQEVDIQVKELLANKELGIVIIDQATMNNCSERVKEDVVSSLDPVFVVVSQTAAQEELRKMIIQSIGVDLLKEEK